jgi:hypothetical protein
MINQNDCYYAEAEDEKEPQDSTGNGDATVSDEHVDGTAMHVL